MICNSNTEQLRLTSILDQQISVISYLQQSVKNIHCIDAWNEHSLMLSEHNWSTVNTYKTAAAVAAARQAH